MFGYIYKITNTLTNKIYIGKHKYDKPELDDKYIASGILINKSIRKYGLNNFMRELIDIAETNDDLNEKEKFYIKKFDCLSPKGYNLTKGGDGISEPSAEIRAINRIKHLGHVESEATKQKRIATLKSIKHTQEWIDKISTKLKGHRPSQLTLDNTLAMHKGCSWCNNGVKEIQIRKNDPIPNGYKRGRLINPFPNQTGKSKSRATVEKMIKAKSNSVWYNNGKVEKMFKDLINIPKDFRPGRLKRKKKN